MSSRFHFPSDVNAALGVDRDALDPSDLGRAAIIAADRGGGKSFLDYARRKRGVAPKHGGMRVLARHAELHIVCPRWLR